MNREILFRGKHIHGMGSNKHLNGTWVHGYLSDENYINDKSLDGEFLVDENTICKYANLTDLKGEEIWENDILMCHGNPKDLVKAVFGEFNVIEVESEEVIDSVIGWHYEVIPTDELSKCEPFCYSMPLTKREVSSTSIPGRKADRSAGAAVVAWRCYWIYSQKIQDRE